MPSTALTVQTIVAAGIEPTWETLDQANGNNFTNDGKIFLYVKNTAVSEKDMTIASPGTCSHGGTHPRVEAIPADEERMFGPFSTSRYNSGTGKVELTFEAGMTGSVAAIKFTA